MSNQHAFTVIHWSGPFTKEDILDGQEGKKKGGLYLVTGGEKHEKKEPSVKYCGITERSFKSRFKEHFERDGTFDTINKELEIWTGKIVSTPFPSRNGAYQAYLKEPERLLTYHLQLPLNDKNKILQPKEPLTVINYWFDTKGKPRKIRKYIAQKGLKDVVSWDGENWRTGNLAFFQIKNK